MPAFSPRAYRGTAAALRAMFRSYFRAKAHHLERVPAEGPVIMAANHASYLDPIILGSFSPRPVHFMMLRSYYDIGWIGFLASILGSFPVDDGGITKFTFKNSQEVLRRGDVMGIFPEGGRSRTGALRPGKPGTMLLALRERALVVPVGIRGAFEAYPPGRWFPHPKPVSVIFGEPITEHLRYQYPKDKEKVTELTILLMARIEELLREKG